MKTFKSVLVSLAAMWLIAGCSVSDLGEVVIICSIRSDGVRGCGTAFPVDEDAESTVFMTTAHIFDPENWEEAESWIESSVYGRIDIDMVYMNFDSDIAIGLVKGDYEFFPYTVCEKIMLLEPVTVYSAMPEVEEHHGHVISPKYTVIGIPDKVVRISTSTRHGNSGSPIVADIPQCVVGMLHGDIKNRAGDVGVRYNKLRAAVNGIQNRRERDSI